MTTLLSTPSSLASSYTRTLATSLLTVRGSSSAGPSLPMHGRTHRVLIECSSQSRPTSDSRGTSPRGAPHGLSYGVACSIRSVCRRSKAVSYGPGPRKARLNARRRTACSRQTAAGCTYAPRPGSVPRRSGTSCPSINTTRSRSGLSERSRQPTQVRCGHARTRVRPDTVNATSPRYRTPRGVKHPTPSRKPPVRPPQPCSAGCPEGAGPVGGASCGSAAASGSALASAVSGRMSIRQPVSRAASRAFCPSLPMASESW